MRTLGTPDAAKLSAPAVFREMWGVYRRHWRFLVPAAAIVLLPQSVGDAVLDNFEVEHLRTVADFATVGAALAAIAVNLLGQAVYAGLTAAAVIDWRAGQPLPPLIRLVRSMPLGRLTVLDLLLTAGAALGFVLLVVPGLLLITYVGISPAILKVEHLGVRRAVERSISLVRGHARRVFVILVGAVLFSEFAVQAVTTPFEGAAALSVANTVAEGIFQPIEGLAIALVAIHLLVLHGEAPEPETMARSLVGEHD